MNRQTHKDLASRRTLAWRSLLLVRRRRAFRRAGLLMVLSAVLTCFGGVLVSAGPAYAAGPYPAPVMSNCAAGLANTAGDANFEVWTCGASAAAVAAADAALNIAENYYPAMTAMMGPPRPDSGSAAEGGDTRIDLYLVSASAGQQITRYDDSDGQPTTSDIGGNTVAEAISSNEAAKSTYASGWMALDGDALSTSSFDSDFVHEFFHLLEYAYNTGQCSNGEVNWFVEASATWAESHFAPSTAADEVYYRFTDGFEESPGMSLTSTADDPSGSSHAYSSFIWPYFMEQETGGTAAIANAWKAMKGKTSCAGMNQAISSALPFQQYFGDFALENFDSPLKNIGDSQESQWPTGFSSMYQQLDNNFPEKLPKESMATPAQNTTTSEPVSVADLATQYNQWKTGLNNYGLSFEFDFSGITNRQNLDIVAIAAEKNELAPHTSRPFLVIPVPASSNYLRICAPADSPTSPTSDITKGIIVNLILANHSITSGGKVGGSYTVTPRSTCAASASGNYTETYSTPGPEGYTETVTLTNMQFFPAPADTGAPGWALDPTQGTYTYTSTYGSGSGPLSDIVQTPPPKVVPSLFAWDVSSPYPPNFGINATEFQTGSGQDLTVAGGACALIGSYTTGKYVNNFQAVDFTCTDSSNGTQISTSGSIQAQDPIPCGIWGGASCPVTASLPAAALWRSGRRTSETTPAHN